MAVWRLTYRFGGREKQVSLKRARDRREECEVLEEGKDPSVQRQDRKESHGVTFELVAKERLKLQRHRFAAATYVKAEWTFTDLINPYIGSRPPTEITAPSCFRCSARGSWTARDGASHTPALQPSISATLLPRTRA